MIESTKCSRKGADQVYCVHREEALFSWELRKGGISIEPEIYIQVRRLPSNVPAICRMSQLSIFFFWIAKSFLLKMVSSWISIKLNRETNRKKEKKPSFGNPRKHLLSAICHPLQSWGGMACPDWAMASLKVFTSASRTGCSALRSPEGLRALL